MNQVHSTIKQFTTFYVGSELFGIDVMKVQEVTGRAIITPVPLAPNFVRGLVNLRGQIATAFGLRELFGELTKDDTNHVSVVCKMDNNLVSLIVDSIGEVVEVEISNFEIPPDTIPQGIKNYINGIYKLDGHLLSVIDLEALSKKLSPTTDVTTDASA